MLSSASGSPVTKRLPALRLVAEGGVTNQVHMYRQKQAQWTPLEYTMDFALLRKAQLIHVDEYGDATVTDAGKALLQHADA